MFTTASSWFLMLLAAVPFVAWYVLRKRKTTSVAFSDTSGLQNLPKTWKQRLAWVPPALRIAAVVLLIVALARPQEGRKQTVSESEGIAIEMVVDRSGSMQAMDFEVEGQPVDRLTAVKDVAGKFITGGEALEGRFSDLIGLVTFARHADGISPPTLDHPFLIAQLNQSEIVDDRNEDGTAIGDAMGLAVEKLTALDNDRDDKVKSKVMILLTDGENNAGDVNPIQAAELAATLGVKIYTIGVGTQGQAPVPVVDPFTGRKEYRMMEVNIDEETLTKVAELTGGNYFRATDTASLAAIYEKIDELEKSRVEEKQYVDYREWAIEPVQVAGMKMPPLVLLALFALVAQVVLSHTMFRRLV
ncbi:von Willebrand factor type A domain protein [Symmachiella macrocystis]|uniref:von Willebrand factor type A domain protein n=1 Tax=Symmachiella macrocystis TaxID=2527985 RepID=A0A5C6BN21_9PLAN|nr:VWA domain-containing protein [Symmachiella macrocystis]TWU13468.1 von Willebrand factor type A domain protein [Symmachiella macrocystis]